MAKKVNAVVERAEDGGYSIYAKDVPGTFGHGLTLQEAKEDFDAVLEEQLEYIERKTGKKSTYCDAPIEYSGADDRVKVVEAVVSRKDGQFFIYTESEVGVSVMGSTLDEAKKYFREFLEEYPDLCRESGAEVPEVLTGEYRVEYQAEESSE